MESKVYDTIIVGAGPCGLYTAYKIITEKPTSQILILDMGNEVSKRKYKRTFILFISI